MTTTLEDIRVQLTEVPDKPGVYLWKDADDTVLYVGKAKALRKRMIQYVTGHDDRAQIPLMMKQVASFDYIVTRNESESLILEINLVSELSPRYNVDLKDDKSYPYIAITLGNTYPAIKYTREKHVEGTRYFGPYTDAKAARNVLDTLRRLMPMCRCTCPEWRAIAREEKAGKPFSATKRPCFDSHIGLGPGVCKGKVDPDAYRAHVEKVVAFLRGQYGPLERTLRELMQESASNLDYEAAAGFRNRIEALEMLKEKQTIVSDAKIDLDVIGTYQDETVAGVFVLVVRAGRVLNSTEFILDKGLDETLDNLLSFFITKYYAKTTEIPKTIAVQSLPEDHALLEQWLTEARRESVPRCAQVHLEAPQRGVKHELLEMAMRNARHALLRWMMRAHYEDERLNDALLQLESALALRSSPYRIECYDISTLHGSHSVGSMVVFTGGKKDVKAYRRFRIRLDSDQPNDVAMMREVLGRRFSPRNLDDKRFASRPDLIIVDGGKPQLNAARQVLDELDLDIDVAGLAKREEELFVVWQDRPVILPVGSPSLYLVKRIRDEAHRFAIEYHRLLRSKAMTASILDEIIGIGPKKRKELVKHFGS
ncbi:MAG: excinuclease ABC subunit UvrC, partial [Coriobacteriia bacterium]|nr:excinuclease ABC subunit UvrC [Coriobacteriia bacterium]